MSLRLKILMPLVSLASILFVYLYAYWMPRSLDNIEAGSLLSIERHLDSVAEGLVPLLLGHQLDMIYANLDSLMKKDRDWISIRLKTTDGRILYPLETSPPGGAESRRGKDIHVVERPIRYSDEELGSLILTVDFAPRLYDIRKRHWELMSVMLVMIAIFTTAASFVVDRLVRRPVNLLARASRRLAEGDFEVPLEKAGDDEIGILVKSFDDMRKAMLEYRSTLQSAHEQLQIELSERMQAEEAIRNAGAYNRSLIEASLDPLVTIGADGRITDVNAATEAVTGYTREKLIGTDFSDYFTEPDKARAGYRQAFDEGFVRDYPLEIRGQNGLVTSVLYNASVYRDEGGQVLGLFAAARDITGRKQAEEEIRKLNAELEQRVIIRTSDLKRKSLELAENQRELMNIVEDLNLKSEELERANIKLKELDRLKSMFIASMSHELRTPLNSIIGFSSILMNEWAGPVTPEQKENLASILRSGKHLLALVNDVIDVSKIEAGKIESVTEDFDIYDVVSEAAAAFTKDIKEKGLGINVQSVHQVMQADRRRLLQCLLNLISNAVKFTGEGTISVCARKAADGKNIEVEVTDTGIGIRESDIQKLFSAFVRLDSALRSTVPGTGLGLYLTNKLVREVMKGDIMVKSTCGKGSRFTIVVPVAGPSRT